MPSSMGGTLPKILDNPELRDLVEPFLRADFKLTETYRPRRAPSLSCPVRAYGGALDEDAPTTDLEAWQEVSTGAFSRRMFAGDHFYLKTERAPPAGRHRGDLSHDPGLRRGREPSGSQARRRVTATVGIPCMVGASG